LAAEFSRDIVSDQRWSRIQSFFDVGFAPALDLRFQSTDDLLRDLREILEPVPIEDSSPSLHEADDKLIRFYRKAEVEFRHTIDKAMRDASDGLLKRLTAMAQQRGLTPLSTNIVQQVDPNTFYFRFGLKLRVEDHLFAQVSHWVRLVGSNLSHVEACFDFVSVEPVPSAFPEPYYQRPAADQRRTIEEVGQKADEIFATLLGNLLEKHERQFTPDRTPNSRIAEL
jgi:predicted RNase H-like HicB family nuclease